jgi:hypothetical protein
MCSISITSFFPFPRSAEIDHLIAKEHVMNEQQVLDEHAFNEVIAVLERRAAAEAIAPLAAGVVDADLQRCHRALARLRKRRLVTRSAAGLVAAAAAVTVLQMSGSPLTCESFRGVNRTLDGRRACGCADGCPPRRVHRKSAPWLHPSQRPAGMSP